MNKVVKYGLWTVVGVLGVAAAGAGYLVLTFNPNDYKGKIIQAVKDSKQRDLHLDGDIKLTFYPSIGVSLSKVSLSEFNKPAQFAALESAHVSLAVMPLLHKEIVVDEVLLDGVQANIVKHADGTTNLDDLLSKSPSQPKQASQPIKFDVASVTVGNTHLSYVDEGTGARYAVNDFKLTTGRLAEDVPSKITLSLGVEASQPLVKLAAVINGMLTFNLEKKLFQFAGMDVQVNGNALDIHDLKLKLNGDVSADPARKEFMLKGLALAASGVKGSDAFEAGVNAGSLGMAGTQFVGDKVAVTAKLNGAIGNISAALSLPGVQSDALSFTVSQLGLNVDVQQPAQTIKLKLSSPLSGNLQAQQFNMSNLVIAMQADGDKLPGKHVSSEMRGNVRVDALKQEVDLALAGGLLQSQLKASLGVRNFATPAINFDVELDQFNADLYLPPKAPDAPKPATTEPEKPFDLSALRKLNIDGSLRVGALQVANVKSKNVRVDVKAHGGVLRISPLSANLYDGSMSGNITVDASQATPSFAIQQVLSGINIAPLSKDAANFDTLEGHGTININVTTQGDRVSALKKALNGTLSLALADGAVKGINVAKQIREAKASLGGGSKTQAAKQDEKTDFSELRASFRITQGVAHNEDLSMKSPLLRLGGIGDINVGDNSMDYLAKATLAGTLEGQGGKDKVGGLTLPLRISGPFADLKYSLDFGAMFGDNAKQQLAAQKAALQQQVDAQKQAAAQQVAAQKQAAQQQLDAKKDQAKTQLQNGLRGLFNK